VGEPASRRTPATFYGGQAVPEGVMMRGAAHWALAVRKPDGDIFIDSFQIESISQRHLIFRRPLLRGVIVLGQSVAIGVKALFTAANISAGEGVELSSRQVGVVLFLAAFLFIGIFILGPAAAFGWIQRKTGGGLLVNVGEGVARVVLFVGYLWLIGRTAGIRRVFQYHGAEHKTIAAQENGEPLEPGIVAHFPKEHVRCGTNFLIIVMLVTIVVFAAFGTPGIVWRLASRLIAVPLIAAVAYEALRLGARFPESAWMGALMAPGLWLQKITTREPDEGQIEVAIASMNEVLRRESAVGSSDV
jgi:uncharacterized protein YqhQ